MTPTLGLPDTTIASFEALDVRLRRDIGGRPGVDRLLADYDDDAQAIVDAAAELFL